MPDEGIVDEVAAAEQEPAQPEDPAAAEPAAPEAPEEQPAETPGESPSDPGAAGEPAQEPAQPEDPAADANASVTPEGGPDGDSRTAFVEGARQGDPCKCPDGRDGTVSIFADGRAVCLPNY